MSKSRDLADYGTAATLDAQTTLTDSTADRVMKVGAFGLGGASIFLNNSNTDAIVENGYYVLVNATNGPVGNPFELQHINSTTAGGLNSGAATQIATAHDLDRQWFRCKAGGAWSPWRENYHIGNVVGTVSQSGGVPTGALVEYGSNANGKYTKFADGTMICSCKVVLSTDVQFVQYPSTFATVPATVTGASDTYTQYPTGTGGNSISGFAAQGWTSVTNLHYIAIGRWHN